MSRGVFNRPGFSLIELMIVVLISTLIIGGVWVIYLMCFKAWEEGRVQITLQQKAGTAMEKIARGVDGQNGIRTATSASCSGSAITYTTKDFTTGASTTRRFFLYDGEIRYDLNTSSDYTDDERVTKKTEVICTSFLPVKNNDVVTIGIQLMKDMGRKQIYLDLTTQIKLRN